jgi:hypothetical protein
MAPPKRLGFTAIAVTAALFSAPMSGLGGGIQSTMRITVNVSPSASFKVQDSTPSSLRVPNAADAGRGFLWIPAPAPFLVINAPLVMPEVIVEVSADVAGAVGDLGADANSPDGDANARQLSFKDIGVALPPRSSPTQGTDLKEAFERAAGEIIYRLDVLNKVRVGRQSPIVISINL